MSNTNPEYFNVLSKAESNKALKDFYLVGLWSYCEGDKIGKVEKITYCSSPKTQFWFNPVELWGLQNTSVQNVLGRDLRKGLDVYRRAMRSMGVCFVVAAILTAAELLMCCYAISSRKGSMLASILAAVSSPFVVFSCI